MTLRERNQQVIDEFRANGGKVGGRYAEASLVLVHHTGRLTGTAYVNPMVYLQAPDDPDVICVFASRRGAPKSPLWYRNLVAVETTTIERGTERYEVDVRELHGAERAEVFAAQVRAVPRFADYAKATQGIREIPVIELKRRA